jgi:hypothetical protein
VSSPGDWGRVGEDGTVYVRTPEGERAVGSYPGASPEEALAYFGRKFEELAGQVALLEQRVGGSTGITPAEAMSSIGRLREQVAGANAVGDLQSLTDRLTALEPKVAQKRAEAEAARTAAREEARTRKEALVAEAEKLAESTSWKASGDRLRVLLEEWKAAPRLDRPADDALWKRFSAARTGFDKRRRTHFAALDAQRDEIKERKETLVVEAETLAASTEWAATSSRFRELMTAWKAAGRAGKADEERLWLRFRAAQDAFFAARAAVLSVRDTEQNANLAAKRALVTEAEALLPLTDVRAAKTAMRSIHERWEAIGHVPREARQALEDRLRVVEDTVRHAEEGEWRRTNPEARARAEAAVAQLRTAITGYRRDLDKAEAAGNDRDVAAAQAALDARRLWLAEAEKTLADFS